MKDETEAALTLFRTTKNGRLLADIELLVQETPLMLTAPWAP